MSKRTTDRRATIDWSFTGGWVLVLGLAGWLSYEVATTTYRRRERFVDGMPKHMAGTRRGDSFEARGDPERGLQIIANRRNDSGVLVLVAIDQARQRTRRGDAVDARDVLREYKGLTEEQTPTLERLKKLLDRATRDGLAVRNGRRGYSLTSEGREVARRARF